MEVCPMNLQVNADHYEFNKYIDKKRWISYWHQLNEVIQLLPSSVLEIGVGAGIFKQIACNFGFNVESVDIDSTLNPDYVASVLDLPFNDNAYDVVVAFQILEHLPYEDFAKALSELRRVAVRYIIISLPDSKTLWRYTIHIPKIGEKNIYIKRPRIRAIDHKFDGEHYWELSKSGYPVSLICQEFKNQGLELLKTYRVPENPYHRFFVLGTEK